MSAAVYRHPAEVPAALRGGVLTIGNFDGVHVGHARLVGRAVALAAGRPVIAVTFEPPPVRLLAPDRAPQRLCTADERNRRLGDAGANAVLVLHTTPELLALPADDFIRRMIVEPLGPVGFVEGTTFGFGRGRAGNVDTLRALGAALGFTVEVVPPVEVALDPPDGPTAVSSSFIRRLLQRGDLAAAARCLGRAYAIEGPVVTGAGQGRVLGYPTINIDHGELQLPADAVYAGRAHVGGATYRAAISVGVRPTFDGARRVVEAFLLDCAGNFYSQTARIEFAAYLREQFRFDSSDALAEQIGRDVSAVRKTPIPT